MFKRSQSINTNELAKFALNQLVTSVSGNKLIEPIDCNKYLINEQNACSFLYSGTDKDGIGYEVLTVVIVDVNNLNHIVSHRADPPEF